MNTLSKNVAILALTVVAISSGGAFAMIQDNEVPQTTSDDITVLGHVEVVARNADGEIKAYRQTDNLIVTNGFECAANDPFGAPQAGCVSIGIFDKIAVGTDTTAANIADTDIGVQASNKRQDGAVADSGQTGAIIDATWLANTLKNGTGTTAIVESALFDNLANTTGNMFARQTFTAINVGASDTLTVTWTVTFAQG